MGNHDYGEAFRAAIGCLAFLSAMWQLVMRVLWARPRHDIIGSREKVGAFATALLLVGVGLANLTHLHLPVTISSTIITIGIILSLWTNYLIYKAIMYLADQQASGDEHTDPAEPK